MKGKPPQTRSSYTSNPQEVDGFGLETIEPDWRFVSASQTDHEQSLVDIPRDRETPGGDPLADPPGDLLDEAGRGRRCCQSIPHPTELDKIPPDPTRPNQP